MTNFPIDLAQFEKEEYCYLTTRGRKTGNPHEIEIWFIVHENSLYIMSGNMERSDWVRNLLQEPRVSIRIAGQTFPAVANLLDDKTVEQMIRMVMAVKYNEWEGQDPSEWARTALVVKFTPQDL
ncbi:MAG: nitroreductase family deazaflavin-dependent oxidoreductase [Anaerolineales bacterium]|jgi:deazaflavin-dependent oxidoreductase (nitroreductase family)|uniref:nitroreductase family deazaflavin-dependent oxidoreductase n=1 Tax=Candidatus Villigracilis vicinus TaxID=3140679 RepID=UPI00313604BA|nr:nitroreductase family deazaflavin-dependent oxidoreductase [Anaerolineales bacterium]MBK7449755.1 nitroreductase family deazaflavin-dependent oxidoreductase [Anaerolineales bacterium]MBK9778438.1 nitroreductase family deazaflavin-dependent oxidoreductase [Anaerolineales bacterium]